MPRDGSGVASKPAGTTFSPNTTIESSKVNSIFDDIYTDLNAARPITAGGTGRTVARLLDGTWLFENTADPTKLLALDLSGITTATTRTLAVPDRNGTVAVPVAPTEQATTSGTSIDFTSIPAGIKQITVSLYKVSTAGGAQLLVQLGDSGGIEATGYEATATQSLASESSVATAAYTTGFGIRVASAANASMSGTLTLTRVHTTDNVWSASGNFADISNDGFGGVAGSKLLSGSLDRIRLTTLTGADTFDAGAVNIMYF